MGLHKLTFLREKPHRAGSTSVPVAVAPAAVTDAEQYHLQEEAEEAQPGRAEGPRKAALTPK